MRNRFDEELKTLGNELIEMGAMIENAIESACRALVTRDVALAKRVFDGDGEVDRMERQIETLCLRLLLQQQPVARDLRLISAAMKMITDMERIGDQAQDISEIVGYIAKDGLLKEPEHISAMAKATIIMVHQSVDAFVRRDLALARRVIESDDQVDELFMTVKSELAQILSDDPTRATAALDLLMIAKYFERIGDHAVNIAEWVEFAMTGIHKGERLQ